MATGSHHQSRVEELKEELQRSEVQSLEHAHLAAAHLASDELHIRIRAEAADRNFDMSSGRAASPSLVAEHGGGVVAVRRALEEKLLHRAQPNETVTVHLPPKPPLDPYAYYWTHTAVAAPPPQQPQPLPPPPQDDAASASPVALARAASFFVSAAGGGGGTPRELASAAGGALHHLKSFSLKNSVPTLRTATQPAVPSPLRVAAPVSSRFAGSSPPPTGAARWAPYPAHDVPDASPPNLQAAVQRRSVGDEPSSAAASRRGSPPRLEAEPVTQLAALSMRRTLSRATALVQPSLAAAVASSAEAAEAQQSPPDRWQATAAAAGQSIAGDGDPGRRHHRRAPATPLLPRTPQPQAHLLPAAPSLSRHAWAPVARTGAAGAERRPMVVGAAEPPLQGGAGRWRHAEPHVASDDASSPFSHSRKDAQPPATTEAAAPRVTPPHHKRSPLGRSLSRRQASLLAATLRPSPLLLGGSTSTSPPQPHGGAGTYTGLQGGGGSRRLSSGLGAGIAVDAHVEEGDEDSEGSDEAEGGAGDDAASDAYGDGSSSSYAAWGGEPVPAGSLALVARGERRHRRHHPTQQHSRTVEEAYARAAAEAEAALAAIRARAGSASSSNSPPAGGGGARGAGTPVGVAFDDDDDEEDVDEGGLVPAATAAAPLDVAAPATARQRSLFTRTLQPAASLPALFAAEVATALAAAALSAHGSGGRSSVGSGGRGSARHRLSGGGAPTTPDATSTPGSVDSPALPYSPTSSSGGGGDSEKRGDGGGSGGARRRQRHSHRRRPASSPRHPATTPAALLLCDAYAALSFRAARGGGDAALVASPLPAPVSGGGPTASPPPAAAAASQTAAAATAPLPGGAAAFTSPAPRRAVAAAAAAASSLDAAPPSSRPRPLRPRVSFAAAPHIVLDADDDAAAASPAALRRGAPSRRDGDGSSQLHQQQAGDPDGRSPIMALLARTSSAAPGRRGASTARRQSARHGGGGGSLLSLAEERFREAIGSGGAADDTEL